MASDLELSALRGEVERLKNDLSQVRAQAQSKDPRIDQLMQQINGLRAAVQNVDNWQKILRGENGITVQGNVIRLDKAMGQNHSEVTETGCLNGLPGFARNDGYTQVPAPFPP